MKVIRENLIYILLGLIALALIFVTVTLQTNILSSQTPASTDESPGFIAFLRVQVAEWILPASADELTTVATADGGDIPDAVEPINAVVAEQPVVEPNTMAALLSGAEHTTVSKDDNILASIIGANRHVVGFLGFTIYLKHQDKLRAVAIRLPNGEVVAPSAITVAMGLYPLARPLYLYTSPAVIQAKPEVEAFLGCYLNKLPQITSDTGYILPNRQLFARAVQSFDATCQRCRRETTTTHPLANTVPSCDFAGMSTEGMYVVGSSTIAPLSLRMAELARELGYGSDIRVESSGTGAGFRNFCVEGVGDIVDASRIVTGEEREICNDANRSVLPFPIAVDALTIVVSHENTFLQNASIEELQQIFAYARSWSEINSTWPNEPISRAIPDMQSGSFDYFVEAVMEEDALANLAERRTTPLADSDIVTVNTTSTIATELGNTGISDVVTDPVIGTKVFVDKQPRVRLGYIDGGGRGPECAAITEQMALIMERNFGLQVALQSFSTADELFATLATTNAAERVDLTFCYLEPEDRPQRQRYFNYTDFINSGYRESGESRLVIMINRNVKPVLERENRCLYQFLYDLNLENVTLPRQSPIDWYEQNRAMIHAWLPCNS